MVKNSPPVKENVTATEETLVEIQANTSDSKTIQDEQQTSDNKIANGSLDHINDVEPLTELEEVFTDEESSTTQVAIDIHKQSVIANGVTDHTQNEVTATKNAIRLNGNSGHIQTNVQIIEQTIAVNGESNQSGELTIDSEVLETFNDTLNRLSSHDEKGKVDTDKIALIQAADTTKDVFAMEHTLVTETSVDSNGSVRSSKCLIQPNVRW